MRIQRFLLRSKTPVSSTRHSPFRLSDFHSPNFSPNSPILGFTHLHHFLTATTTMCTEDNCELSNSGLRPDEFADLPAERITEIPPPRNVTVTIRLNNPDNDIVSLRGEHTAILSVIHALKTRELEINDKEVQVQAKKWALLGCSSVVLTTGFLCIAATKLIHEIIKFQQSGDGFNWYSGW